MPEGSNIQIRIAATGGDQAAAEIRKVEQATNDLNDTSRKEADTRSVADELGMTEKKASAARVYAKELENADQREAAIHEKRMSRLNSMATGAGVAAVAATAAAVSQTFGQISQGLDSIDIEKLRQIDAATADQVESAKMWADGLKDPIGLLLKLTTGETVGEAFAGMNQQIALTAQQHKEQIDRIITDSKEQADSLKKLTDEIKAANKILDAKDAADAKASDRKDAEAIRNGEHPEDVKAKRAEDDAAKEIERINRGLVPNLTATNAAYSMIGQTKSELGRVEREGGTPEDIEKAKKAIAEAEAEYAKQKKELDTAQAVAAEQRRGVRESAAGKVEDLGSEKRKRIEKEREQLEEEGNRAIEKAIRDQEKNKREAEKQQREAEKGEAFGIRRQGAEAKLGADAVKLLPDGVRSEFRSAVEKAARGLQDGDQGGEVKELISLMNTLASAVKGKDASTEAALAGLRREVATLQHQIKNNRR